MAFAKSVTLSEPLSNCMVCHKKTCQRGGGGGGESTRDKQVSVVYEYGGVTKIVKIKCYTYMFLVCI